MKIGRIVSLIVLWIALFIFIIAVFLLMPLFSYSFSSESGMFSTLISFFMNIPIPLVNADNYTFVCLIINALFWSIIATWFLYVVPEAASKFWHFFINKIRGK